MSLPPAPIHSIPLTAMDRGGAFTGVTRVCATVMIDTTVEDIEAMGLDCQLVDGEFKINFAGGRESSAYYTPDPASAIEAARIMADLQKGLA